MLNSDVPRMRAKGISTLDSQPTMEIKFIVRRGTKGATQVLKATPSLRYYEKQKQLFMINAAT